ncbi:MAG: hypothetical protein PHS94_10125 [Erysipelotrichaceae bacterium]|nr:hypothetical protein [Erysipelotrichaceae bacterium]
MSTEEKIIKVAKEKLEEVFDVTDRYQAEQDDKEFDKAGYVNKLKEQVASEEASLKARQVLRDQLRKEAKEKIDEVFNEEERYQAEQSELNFNKEEYVAKLKEKVAEAIKK